MHSDQAAADTALTAIAGQPDAGLCAARDALTGEGVLALDRAGALVCANPALAAIWGVPAHLLAHGGAAPLLAAMAARVRAAADDTRWIDELRRDAGGRTHAEIMLQDGRIIEQQSLPVPATADRPAVRLFVFRDVSALNQAARRAQQAEARWRVLAEQELVGTCIILPDRTVAYANHAFAGVFGREPQAMIGRPILEFLPAAERDRVAAKLGAGDAAAGDADARDAAARDAAAGDAGACDAGGVCDAGAGGIAEIAITLVREDGGVTDLLIRSGVVSYLGEQALLACTFDITHLRQARRDLQVANQAVEESPVVAFQVLAQPGFPCVYVSRNVARFGYSAEDVKQGAFRFPDHVHPDDRPAVLAALDAIAAGRSEVLEADYRIVARDGSAVWVHDRTIGVRDASGALVAYRGIITDVTQRVLAERRLARTNRALRALSGANGVLVHAVREDALLRDMCRVLVEAGGYASAWISFAAEGEDKPLRKVAIHGEHRDLIEKLSLSWGDNPHGGTPTGLAVRTGRSQVNDNFATNPVMAPWRDEWHRRGCGSSAALPLKNAQGVFGAVSLVARDADAFDQEEMDLLEEMARDLSFGIGGLRMRAEHERLQQRLQRSMNDTVQALAATLELRDPYTAGHQRNVMRLAEAIGAAMGVPADDLEGIKLGAALHDIGKIRIPLEISGRPGKLSLLEMRLMQTHVDSGYEILKGIDFPWPIAAMVRQHHERLDGSGYPLGLRGSQILLGARIIAVADVADSMLAHRPYRPSLGLDATMAELRRGRGPLYDPAVVDACLALLGRDDRQAAGDGVTGRAKAEGGTGDGGDGATGDGGIAGGATGAPGGVRGGAEAAGKPPPRLTMQQSAVMQLLAQGDSIEAIARIMEIAPDTVQIHVRHACAALGARTRIEAIMRAGFQPVAGLHIDE